MQYCKSRFGYRVAYPVSVFFLYIIQVPKCNNRKREIPRGEKMMKGMKLVPEEREKEIHIYDGASINIKNKKKKRQKIFYFIFSSRPAYRARIAKRNGNNNNKDLTGFIIFPIDIFLSFSILSEDLKKERRGDLIAVRRARFMARTGCVICFLLFAFLLRSNISKTAIFPLFPSRGIQRFFLTPCHQTGHGPLSIDHEPNAGIIL